MTITITVKRIIAAVLTIAALLSAVTACDKEIVDEATETPSETTSSGTSVLPVKLMTREANSWTEEFESEVINIEGDGTYLEIIKLVGEYTVFPNIAISAVGTDTADRVFTDAVPAPAEYKNSTVTVDSVLVNGEPLALIDNEDILLIAESDSLEGYANVQLWNAWWEPSQRIDTENSNGVTVIDMGYDCLKFSSPVKTIEIEFTVSGYGSDAPPEVVTTVPAETIPFVPEEPVDITISGAFDASLTSEQLVGQIKNGWNLGNTLDAYNADEPSEPFPWIDYNNMYELETAWINGVENVTTRDLIKRLKEAGFDAIRFPVTWYKMAGGEPDYKIEEKWLAHVQNIVNMAVAEDMYIILNTHHDEYIMRFDEDAAVGERAVAALWTQIAERFKDYNEKLIFEGLNEPRARNNAWDVRGSWDWSGDEDKYITLNRWNQAFVNAVRGTGGNNEKRHLMLATYAAQSYDGPINGFELPTDPITGNGTDRFIWSIHVYSPHNWAHNANGTYDGASAVQNDLERVAERAAELGLPVIFGEWGSVSQLDIDMRVQHAYDYIKIATEMRERSENPVVMACFWWDNASDFGIFKRAGKNKENGDKIIAAIMKAREGLPLE
ncbi:MAG: glycoside hydrolase family 5 protein [Oscillospiraceae bacterium]|nr:glycoside hydrolase family 5 protein [Oscillospiraceae bacterium]